MEEKNYTGVIPKNYTGKIIDAKCERRFDTSEEAQHLYNMAKNRLVNVNSWHELAGTLSGSFQLTDKDGHAVYRQVQNGDHFRVNIPGPGNSAGEGYDWVKVEALEETRDGNLESIAFRVRPASSPVNDKESVAHFYSPESTSTFTVTREGQTVTASIYDRNIEPNTDGENIIDKVRNAIVGTGAQQAFSKLQWQALVDAVMKED